MTDNLEAYRAQKERERAQDYAAPDPQAQTEQTEADQYRELRSAQRSYETEEVTRRIMDAEADGGTPDQYAADRRLAEDFRREVNPDVSPPLSLVGKERNRFTSELQRSRVTTALDSSPLLRKWLNNDQNARIAADDIENMSKLEGFFRATGRAIKRGTYQRTRQVLAQSDANKALDAYEDFNDDGTRKSLFDLYREERGELYGVTPLNAHLFNIDGPIEGEDHVGAALGAVGSVLNREFAAAFTRFKSDAPAQERVYEELIKRQGDAAEWARRASETPLSATAQRASDALQSDEPLGFSEAVNIAAKQFVNDPASMLAMIGEVGVESAGAMLPAAAGTFATKNPGVGIAIAGGTSYSVEALSEPVAFFAEQGYDLTNEEQVKAALANTELMEEARRRGHIRGLVVGGFDLISGGVAGKVLSKNAVADVVLQSSVGGILGATGEGLAQAAVGDEIDFGEVLIEAFAEFSTAPIDVTLIAGRRFGKKRAEAKKAQETQEQIDNLVALAEESKLRDRDPEAFRDFVEKAAEGGNDTLLIPIDAFTTFFQEQNIPLERIAEILPGVEVDQVQRAQLTGEDVRLPVSTYVERVVGSEIDGFVRENSRFTEEGLTLVEANAFTASEPIEQARIARQQERERALQTDDERIIERVRTQVVDSLVSAGRSRQVAEQEGQLIPTFLATLAQRTGQPVADVVRRYRTPQVRGVRPEPVDNGPAPAERTVEQVDRDVAGLRTRIEQRARGGNFADATFSETPENEYLDSVEQAVIDAGLDPAEATDVEIREALQPSRSTFTQQQRDTNNGQQNTDRTGTQSSVGRGVEPRTNGRGQRESRTTTPLKGAPKVGGEVFGPVPSVVEAANGYADAAGIDFTRPETYVKVEQEFAERVAQAYDEMVHEPDNPEVKEAYEELKQQTRAQYDYLVSQGFEFYFYTDNSSPYSTSPWDAMRDLRDTKRMAVYSTAEGYGSSDADVADNPLLEETEITWQVHGSDEQRTVTANDLFRAVHDAFGHGLEGSGFYARGEENAYRSHMRLYHGKALGAAASELRGQNSWVNFGPHAEHNRTASVLDTIYADQKTGLMPEWAWGTDGLPVTETATFKEWFGDSKVVDENGEPLVVYHGTGKKFEAFRGSPDSVRRGTIFFTDNEKLAESYTPDDVTGDTGRGTDPTTYEVYLSADNLFSVDVHGATRQRFDPFEVTVTTEQGERTLADVLEDRIANDPDQDFEFFMENIGVFYEEGDSFDGIDSGNLPLIAEYLGFNGTKIVNVVDVGSNPREDTPRTPQTVYAITEPTRVKSVDNQGTFDAKDPRILYQTPIQPRRDENGFFSKLENAVINMRLPGFVPSKKNPTGAARAKDILDKIKKEQIKAEELEWTRSADGENIIDTLEAMGDRTLTREDTVQIIRAGGLRMEIMENAEGDVNGESFGYGLNGADLDSAEPIDFYSSDNAEIYEEDVELEINEYINDGDNYDIGEVLADINKNIDLYVDVDARKAARGKVNEDLFADDPVERENLRHENYLQHLRDEHEVTRDTLDANDKAKERIVEVLAERRYTDSPDYELNIDHDDYDLSGFRVEYLGRNEDFHIWYNDEFRKAVYDEGELAIRIESIARDEGLIDGQGDEGTRWSEYVTPGPHDNYREFLITLPDTEGSFVEDAHFETENVVTFLRTTDRDVQVRERQYAQEPDEEYERGETKIEQLPWGRWQAILYTADGGRLGGVTSQNSTREGAEAELSNTIGNPVPAAYHDRDGKIVKPGRKVLKDSGVADAFFLDEMQSDWHQRARKGYYDSAAGRAQLEAELAKVEDAAKKVLSRTREASQKIADAEKTMNAALTEDYAATRAEVEGYIDAVYDTEDAVRVRASLDLRKQNMDNTGAGYQYFAQLKRIIAKVVFSDDIPQFGAVAQKYKAAYDKRTEASTAHGEAQRAEWADPDLQRYDYLRSARAVPDAPFKNDAWITLGMRKAAMLAVDEGKKVFAWADAQTVGDRWSNQYMEAYTNQYDRKMPGIAKKIFGAKPVHLNLDGTPHTPGQAGMWVVDLETAKRVESIRKDGLPLFQREPESSAPKGQISIPADGIANGQSVIDLFATADLSTFLHESSHFFLSVFQDAAQAADADPELRAMYETTKDWWASNIEDVAKEAGVTTLQAQQYLANGTVNDRDIDARMDVATQEQWARAFETYLMEGKAPTVELRGAFEQFRAWLLAVYRRVKGDLNVTVTDDIRQVFDMLLATDAQIEANKVNPETDMLANTAAELGVTDEDYATLEKLHRDAQDQAAGRAIKDAMEPIRKMRSEKHRKRVKEVKAEVEAEVNARPVYRAIEWLGNKRWLGTDEQPAIPTGMRLSKQQLVERYGPGVLRTLPRGSFRVYTPGGMDIDEAAGWFGYDSGDALVKAMETAPKRQDVIAHEAEARVLKEFESQDVNGEIASAAQTVTDAFHNDKQASYIAAELRTLNKQLGTDENGKRFSTASYAREVARRTIAGMKARDAIASNRYLRAERRAAEAAQAAFAAGDKVKAANEKRKQLLNHMLYVQSRKVAEDVAKTERLAKRLQSKGTRKNLAVDYLGAIDDTLEQYDFRKIGPGKERTRERLLAYVQFMKDAGRENELAIPQHVLENARAQPYLTLTVDELRGVHTTLKNIEHTARLKQKLIDAEGEREIAQIVGDFTDAFEANIKKRTPSRVETKGERARNTARQFLNLVLNADTLLREIDGNSIGAVYNHMKSRIDKANGRLQVRRTEAAHKFEELYSVYSKKERNQMAVEKQDDNLGFSISKWDKISIVLNMGNADNIQRLTDSRVKGSFTEDQINKVVAEMDKRDMDFVQSVWDYIDTFYAEIAAREKRVTGVEPQKVQAQEVVTEHGTYKGGYYPLSYDARLSSRVAEETNEDIMRNMQGGRFGKAQTRNGHTKERAASSGRPVMLDIGVLHGHINTVLHDLELSEPVTAAWRILQNADVKGLFQDYGRSVDHQSLEMWVQDTASGQINSAHVLSRVARKLKSGFTVSKLAFNLSTVAVQVTGLAQSMVVIGKKDFTLGAIDYLKSPVEASRRVTEISAFMAERETTFNKDIYDVIGDIKVGPTAGPYKRFKSEILEPLGFWLMQKSQFYAVDMPTWMGAYRKGMRELGDVDLATEFANRMVVRSQATSIFGDRSPIERGTLSADTRQNDFVRLFTTLGSYMFAKANVAYERVNETNFRSPKEVLSLTMDMALLFTVEAILYNAIKGTLPGMGEDDDEEWAAFLAKETAFSIMSTMPFVRDAASPLQGYSGGGAYGSVVETLVTPIVTTANDLKDDEEGLSKTNVKAWVNTGGMLLHLPSTQTNRIVDAAWRASEGEEVAPIEYVMGAKK